MKPSGIITFLSDFGLSDWFVAAVKGEILKKNKHAVIVDVTHSIEPHDIYCAAFILSQYFKNYPQGTVHLVVVDPGVGSERRGIAVVSKGYVFIAPDNGILSYVMENDAIVYNLPVPEYASATFHGRDVFGPAAACFSMNSSIPYKKLEIADCLRFEFPRFNKKSNPNTGEIIYIDRFGNCITNIPVSIAVHELRVNDVIVPHVSCYAEGKSGEPVTVKGSSGYYEISVNQGDAQDIIQATIGSIVVISK